MNEIIVNNEEINALALTTMVEKGILHPAFCLPYADLVKLGWQFYFIIKDNGVFAVMTGKFPHKSEYFARKANPYISKIIKESVEKIC